MEKGSMPGSEPNQEHPSGRIWYLGIIAALVFGIMMQAKPINIAASDVSPSISDGFDEANSISTHQRRSKGGVDTLPAQPNTQLFYGGWTVPQ
jgi:hypothetical protein